MTNTYHNNDSGGTVFQPTPAAPIDRVDRVSPPTNPTLSVPKPHFQNGGESNATQ
jgi:hypothetical protein